MTSPSESISPGVAGSFDRSRVKLLRSTVLSFTNKLMSDMITAIEDAESGEVIVKLLEDLGCAASK